MQAQDKFCEQPYFCMLCVHDETYPFLELYEDQKASLSHKPLKVIPLINCQHISPNLNSAQQFNSFTVTLATEIHQFRAGSNSDMHDWITVFRSRLQELQSTEVCTSNVFVSTLKMLHVLTEVTPTVLMSEYVDSGCAVFQKKRKLHSVQLVIRPVAKCACCVAIFQWPMVPNLFPSSTVYQWVRKYFL